MVSKKLADSAGKRKAVVADNVVPAFQQASTVLKPGNIQASDDEKKALLTDKAKLIQKEKAETV